jgi:molecular chaperone GrpE
MMSVKSEKKPSKSKGQKETGAADTEEVRDKDGIERPDPDASKNEPDSECEEASTENPAEQGAEGEACQHIADEAGESYKDMYFRARADYQNLKKRTEKEKSDIYTYANEKFASDLLDVLDNFDRAVGQNAAEGAGSGLLEGMEMIRIQLASVLSKNKVEEIAAEGEEFDPNFHHAVMMESSDKYESGKVTEVLQKGYRLKEKVIRPAMVKVAQ